MLIFEGVFIKGIRTSTIYTYLYGSPVKGHNQEYPSHCPWKAPSQMGHNKSGEAVSHNLSISCRIELSTNFSGCVFLFLGQISPDKWWCFNIIYLFQNFERGFYWVSLSISSRFECFCWNQIPNFLCNIGGGVEHVFLTFSKLGWKGLSGNSWMYPYQRTPTGNPYISPISMGYNLQESLENTINIMGTLLGVHPIVPWVWINNICSYGQSTPRPISKFGKRRSYSG